MPRVRQIETLTPLKKKHVMDVFMRHVERAPNIGYQRIAKAVYEETGYKLSRKDFAEFAQKSLTPPTVMDNRVSISLSDPVMRAINGMGRRYRFSKSEVIALCVRWTLVSMTRGAGEQILGFASNDHNLTFKSSLDTMETIPGYTRPVKINAPRLRLAPNRKADA